MASVAICNAVSNPKETSVFAMSLSIVFGRSPKSASFSASVLWVPRSDANTSRYDACRFPGPTLSYRGSAADFIWCGLSRLVPGSFRRGKDARKHIAFKAIVRSWTSPEAIAKPTTPSGKLRGPLCRRRGSPHESWTVAAAGKDADVPEHESSSTARISKHFLAGCEGHLRNYRIIRTVGMGAGATTLLLCADRASRNATVNSTRGRAPRNVSAVAARVNRWAFTSSSAIPTRPCKPGVQGCPPATSTSVDVLSRITSAGHWQDRQRNQLTDSRRQA